MCSVVIRGVYVRRDRYCSVIYGVMRDTLTEHAGKDAAICCTLFNIFSIRRNQIQVCVHDNHFIHTSFAKIVNTSDVTHQQHVCRFLYSGVMKAPSHQAVEGVQNHLEVSLCNTQNMCCLHVNVTWLGFYRLFFSL